MSLLVAILIIISSVLSLSASSIGIQNYNKSENEGLKEQDKSKYYFLVANLVSAIILIIIAAAMIYFSIMSPF
jgi:hypothetical protein